MFSKLQTYFALFLITFGVLFTFQSVTAQICTQSTDCPRGQTCINDTRKTKDAGTCVDSAGKCTIEHECPSGQTCVSGKCTTAPTATGTKSCKTDADCGTGGKCVSEKCAVTTPSGTTTSPGTAPGTTQTTTLDNPLNVSSIGDLIVKIINYILGFVAIIAAVFIMYGGFQYATSSGSEQKVQKGKTALTAGIIGVVISLGAYTIIRFVFSALGAG